MTISTILAAFGAFHAVVTAVNAFLKAIGQGQSAVGVALDRVSTTLGAVEKVEPKP